METIRIGTDLIAIKNNTMDYCLSVFRLSSPPLPNDNFFVPYEKDHLGHIKKYSLQGKYGWSSPYQAIKATTIAQRKAILAFVDSLNKDDSVCRNIFKVLPTSTGIKYEGEVEELTVDDEFTVDVGYEITEGGEKKHVWMRPQDVKNYVEGLRSEIRDLKESNSSLQKANQAFATGSRTFHNCKNGTVKPYASFLCSSCSPVENEDFDAAQEIEKLRKENSRLKEIEEDTDYYRLGGIHERKKGNIDTVGELRHALSCSDNEELIAFDLWEGNQKYQPLDCIGLGSAGGGRMTVINLEPKK